jgi:hypothetical protein
VRGKGDVTVQWAKGCSMVNPVKKAPGKGEDLEKRKLANGC